MAKDEKAPKVPKAKTAPKGNYFKRAEDRPQCKCSAPPKTEMKTITKKEFESTK